MAISTPHEMLRRWEGSLSPLEADENNRPIFICNKQSQSMTIIYIERFDNKLA